MKILVIKFGGTSIGNAEAMLRSAALVRGQVGQWDGVVVVVSAMRGATNQLLNCGIAAAGGSQADLEAYADSFASIHSSAINTLEFVDEERLTLDKMVDDHLIELHELSGGMRSEGQANPEQMDALGALGELSCAPLFAALLRKSGLKAGSVDARQCILTDSNFQNAVVEETTTRSWTRATLLPMVAKGIIPVVTGFIGTDSQGHTTTLGRGAGDYSSTIVAGCLDAAEVWNLTDVDGVMTADPRLVPDARTIGDLSFDEMKELAIVGARVLHPDTVFPLVKAGIPLRVMNTFNHGSPGTLIHPGSGGRSKRTLGVVCTFEGQLARVSVVGGRWSARRLRRALIRQGIQVLAAENSSMYPGVLVVVAAGDGERTARVIHNLVFGAQTVFRRFGLLLCRQKDRIIEGLRHRVQRGYGRRVGGRLKAPKM